MESASKSTGLFLNPSKTKYIHINPSANDSVHSSDGSQIEEVEDFKYLGSYTNFQHDIQCRKAQAWAAVHAHDNVWRAPICRRTKQKIFRTTVELILIYGCDSIVVTNTISRKCTGWHLHKNAAENSKCVMVPPHDQPRTVRLPPTDHHHRETTASSSGRSCDAP